MTDDMKLYWKLFSEWFPNEKILSGFYNPLKEYYLESNGKIIDIGCGQSTYLLDFVNSDFELFAVDTDEMQLNFLRDRIEKLGYEENRINYSSQEFPSENFKSITFTGIIVSNLLHFFSKPDACDFISNLKKYSKTGTLILITVHSTEHLSNQKEITSASYFKSFYSKADLYEMFPISEFEYLYYIEKEKLPDNYKKKFLNNWISEFYKKKYNTQQIQKTQENYLKNCKINSLDFLVRKR